jgi:hypothetical protein
MINISHISTDFDVADLMNTAWSAADETTIDKYWSNEKAPAGRHFLTRLLWSETSLYVRFDANKGEPLTISEEPDLSKKTIGMWERDVCEIFLAPDANEPRKYFEFEVAPTAEWIDLTIDLTSGERITDWDFTSGMKAAARIDYDRVVMAIRVPWKAFGTMPKQGNVWMGNLFRCVGSGADRGYLAWQPTSTPKPEFHIPSAFREFRFA